MAMKGSDYMKIKKISILKILYPDKAYLTSEISDKCSLGERYEKSMEKVLCSLQKDERLVYYDKGTWKLTDIGIKYVEEHLK
jgi:hypothetical protein